MSIAAVFKLGSADQRGSATGSQGVRERTPKSSHCLQGFNNLRPICFQICTHKSVTQCIAWKCCPVRHDRLSVDVS